MNGEQTMSLADLLTLFDREMRIEVDEPGAEKQVTPEVVRYLNHRDGGAWVLYSRLTEENIDRVIEEQIAYFEQLGREFEWKVYAHDWPSDLADRLERRGFTPEETEALLVLDLENAPESLLAAPRNEIRRLTDPAQFADVAWVEEQVWNEPYEWLAAQLTEKITTRPDDIQVYAAYVDGQPVSAAWMHFHPGSQFASLWGGSTLAEYRGRGIYHDLVGARAQQARQRGVRYLTVDASPMSRPILERLGFEVISMTTPLVWKNAADATNQGAAGQA